MKNDTRVRWLTRQCFADEETNGENCLLLKFIHVCIERTHDIKEIVDILNDCNMSVKKILQDSTFNLISEFEDVFILVHEGGNVRIVLFSKNSVCSNNETKKSISLA